MFNDDKMLYDTSLLIKQVVGNTMGAAGLIGGWLSCFVLDTTQFESTL